MQNVKQAGKIPELSAKATNPKPRPFPVTLSAQNGPNQINLTSSHKFVMCLRTFHHDNISDGAKRFEVAPQLSLCHLRADSAHENLPANAQKHRNVGNEQKARNTGSGYTLG